MFVERGFDAVSVAAVARAAEVSEATVFNYFPTKEDLVYQGMEAFETELLAAVRDRPAGSRSWRRSPGSCCDPAGSSPRRTRTRPATSPRCPG
jgi:AcrR family transcriptional regulator